MFKSMILCYVAQFMYTNVPSLLHLLKPFFLSICSLRDSTYSLLFIISEFTMVTCDQMACDVSVT